MVIPGVAFSAADWILLCGVVVALYVGVVMRQTAVMLYVVIALALGLSPTALPAAGWVAVLVVLPTKLFAFLRPG